MLRLQPRQDDRGVSDTRTGGALSISAKGDRTFIVERGLHQRIEQLTPIRKVHADMYNGEPLDCLGGVINDLVADSQGGVYFTMGGLFYADKDGKITRYGENLTTNGVTLSPDEKNALCHQRRDARGVRRAEGRLADEPARVREAHGGRRRRQHDRRAGPRLRDERRRCRSDRQDGKHLGVIPTPRGVITARSAARTGRRSSSSPAAGTAHGEEVANVAQVWTIPMVAQGFKGRAK